MPRNCPDQVEKHHFLGTQINQTGIEMFPCSFCEKFNREYIVSPEESSKHCSKYVILGHRCNIEGIPIQNWTTLQKEEDRLYNKCNTTFQQIEETQYAFVQAQATNIAKIRRLEKQQKFLRCCSKEMLRYSFQTLDKLDTQEEKEKKEKDNTVQIEFAATAAHKAPDLLSYLPISDLSSEDLLVFELSFWRLMAGSSKTPPVSQGS
jgi:hypothetical protein